MSSPPRRKHSEKAMAHIEGDDEFSLTSVDPDKRRPMVELKVEHRGRVRATQDERTIWRLFRKLLG